MHAEVAYGYRERKAHADAMGEVAHRLHCLQHLKLKTVIKVSASSITSVTVVGDAMLTAYLVISLKCCDRP